MQYLVNHRGESRLPHVAANVANYEIAAATRAYQLELPRRTTGYTPLIVELGQMLEYTLQSPDVREAFGGLDGYTLGDSMGGLLVFDLQSYDFSDMHARVKLKITYRRWGTDVFSKVYQADGTADGGMAFGDVLAMKEAVHEATKHALDDVLRQLIRDLNGEARY